MEQPPHQTGTTAVFAKAEEALLLNYVLALVKLFASPMAPVVQRVRFGNQAVFPHNLPHTAIRLEDTGTQEDVSAGEDRHNAAEAARHARRREG